MSFDQKYKDEIEKLTNLLAHTKSELNFQRTMQLSLEDKVPDLDATQREKELEAELKISQLARNELQKEFEKMQKLHEKTDKYKIFFELMAERDTPEIQSLTVDQFDKQIKRFFKMMSDQYPDDRQKCLDHGRKAWKCLCLTQHPDKNSNDTGADEKFKAFNQAYENFKK
jgi:hypothetical protein